MSSPSQPNDSPQSYDLDNARDLLRATLDASTDMIQVFEAVRSEQGQIIDFIWILNNHASEKIYGDVVGKRLLELQPGVAEEGIFEAFKQVVETGQPLQYDKHYVHEQFDGWFHQSVVKLNDGVVTTTADITIRKTAEQELKTTQEFLQATLDSSVYVVQAFKAVRDQAGKIIDFTWLFTNKQWREKYGPDMAGKSMLRENPAVIETGLFDHFVRVTETGETHEHEHYYPHEQFDAWFHQTEVKMGDGFVMNAIDITERKKAEQELLASRDLVQTVFNVSLNPIAYHKAVRDTSGKIIDFEFQLENQQARKYAEEDRTGKRYSEAYPGIRDTIVFKKYCEVVETGISVNEEVQLNLKGIDRCFHLMAVKLDDGLVATAFDVTEQKDAEKEILRLKDEAARSVTNKYYSIFNSIDEGFCVYEVLYDLADKPVDLRWLEVNPAYEKQTGLTDVVGKRHSDLSLSTENYWYEYYDHVIKTGEAVRFENWHQPTGRWYQVYASRIEDVQSRQVAVVFSDITERKAVERQQAFLLRFSDTLRLETNPDAVANRALQLLIGQLNLDRSYITTYYLDQNRADVDYQTGNETVPPLPDYFDLSHYPDAFKTILDQTIVIEDELKRKGLSEAEIKNSGKLGMRAMVGATVRKGADKPLWSMVAISSTPRRWTKTEVALIEEVAERTWLALERAKVEASLRNSEEKYRTLFESVDEGFCVIELVFEQGRISDMIYREANAALEIHTGYRVKPGTLLSEFDQHVESYWHDSLMRVHRTGVPERVEGYNANTERWYSAQYSRVGDAAHNLIAVVFDDITERKQRETEQALLLAFGDKIRPIAAPVAVEGEATHVLRAHFDAGWCYYVQWDEVNKLGVVRRDASRTGLASLVGEHDVADVPEFLELLKANPLLNVSDYENYAMLTPELRQRYTSLGFRSMLIATLVKQERLVASLLVGDNKIRHWSTHEEALLMQMAERTWAAVERAKAEEALRTSQKRFESIANLVPDLLWDSEPNGSTNWYNQRWLEYTGQTFEEAVGWGRVDTIHPDDREGSARRYADAVESGKPIRQEHRIRRHDGEYRWFVVNASPLRDENGQVIKMYGSATDIHESRKIQETLQRRESELALVQQIGMIGGVDIDVANHLAGKRSPEYLRLHGLPVDTGSETHEDWLRRLHPDDKQRAEQTLFSALQGKQYSYESEYRIIRPDDGRHVWIYAKLDIERDAAGEPVRLIGVHIDITRRKQAEENLRKLEQRNRLAIEAADLATWEWDLVSDQVHWNEQHFLLFGMTVLADPVPAQTFMDHLHPDDAASVKDQLTQAITQRTLFDAEFRIIRNDGAIRWMSGYGRVTGEHNGQPVQASGVMFDITERKHAQEALEEANRRKDEFLAMLAHELRNPMSTIRSGLKLLNLTIPDEITRKTISMMDRQTDHLVRMVDDLLDVSRISQGKIQLKKERINLVVAVRQAVESVVTIYEAQGKSLHYDDPQTPIYLHGDATRLTQVVANLLSNGARYTGEHGQVWLSLNLEKEEAILAVRDDGIGLAADQLSAIFELFVQVDNSLARSKGGLGLGLTLVKRLVEMHGGRVEALSDGLGRGSTFRVYLPTLPTGTEPISGPVQENDQPVSSRILVIDDNADAALTLGMLLKFKGYEVHSRTSGRSGMEAAENLRPAVILLDIGMPEMDGYETCRLIRQQPWGRDMIVIALTGYGQQEDLRRTREAGFSGHLTKPVDLDSVIEVINEFLHKD